MSNDDMLVSAVAYSKKGWVVHPLASPQDKGKSPGKRPLLKEWQKLKETPKDIDSHIKNGRNIGLVCGNASDVTVIDFDHEIFINELLEGIEIDTLMCRRTQGRGHIYFKYNPKLPSQPHHDLGIEILSDGRNAVLPPSIHASGESYKWNDPDKQIVEMPGKLVENLIKLFKREKNLNSLISKCRPCFKKYWKDETKLCHGPNARLFLGAFCSELFNKGADLDLIKMFSKIIYREGYDEGKTINECNGWTQKGYKPWTCDKIREQCVGFTDCDNCKMKKSGRTNVNGNNATYSQASALIAYVNSTDVELFHDDRGDSYARASIDGKNTIMPVQGREFRWWLTGKFFDETGTAPGSDAIIQALNVIEAKAWRKGKEYKLHNRIASHDGAFWYDIGDGTAARIDERGWEIKNPPILFKNYSHQKPHSPSEIMSFRDKGGNVKHILDFVNLRDETDRLLFVVYLISCFVPDIPHPIPEAHGDHGSAKSTAFKLLKQVIDPSLSDKLHLPKDNQALVQILDHHYFAPFDNLSTLSDAQSDALCRACTGEGFSKRALYTNDQDVIYNYQRCVALNGINVVATRPDLLDRSILFRFERIPKPQRKLDDELLKNFENAKGEILAGIFTILSKAMKIKDQVRLLLHELPRMAAFMVWGCAISEVLGVGWKAFYDAYNANIQSQNREALSASPIGEMILKFMEDKPSWEGRAAQLLSELEDMAGLLKINTKDKDFPKAPNSLTRKLNEIKTNLLEEGIQFEVRRNEKVRILFLLKVSENAVSTVIPSVSTSGGGTKHDSLEKTNGQDTVRDDQADDTCKSPDDIPSVLPSEKNQAAAVMADGTDANDGISPNNLGDEQKQNICDICKQPLNGNKEIEQGIQGQGLIHKECKYLPIKIIFLIDVPDFCKYPDGNHRSYKAGDEDYIQATQACALILKHAAIRIDGSV